MGNKAIIFGVLYSLLSVTGTLAESFPYHESFESGLGRWEPDATSDFDWSWHSGPTGSWYTGPSGAHDRDWYVYTEASFPNYGGKTAILQAEFDISSLAEPMISFRYHVYGGTMGKLWLQVYHEDSGGYWENLWSKSSSTHTSHDDPWIRKEYDLQPFAGETSLKIRFYVETGSDWESDICIDDIWLYDNDVVPDRFVWEAIGDRQIRGQAFPVQVEAVNSSGERLTSFNEAVELFAWSDGFANSVENGDFEEPLSTGWTPVIGIFDSHDRYLTSVYGSGKAFALQGPDTVEDGLQQEVFLNGGETYTISAKSALANNSGSPITSDMTCQIRVDGTPIGYSHHITSVAALGQSWSVIYGYYTPAEDGTHTVQLVATSSAGYNSNLYAYFDDVSVSFAPPQYIVTDPGSGTFSNGVWSGNMVLDSRLPATKLIARYVDVMGESNPFSTYTSANDMDGDGMLDTWEVQYFGSTALCSPLVDSDGDGYSNADEYFLGTIPTDMDSSLDLSTVISANSECILTWYSVEGHTYDVEWTSHLLYYPFTNIASRVPHPKGCFTNDTDVSGSQGYYRLKVRKQ